MGAVATQAPPFVSCVFSTHPSGSVTLASIGPSEVSSYQPSLLANVFRSVLLKEADLPKPPKKISRPFSSVRNSPRSTFISLTVPLLVPEIVQSSKWYLLPSLLVLVPVIVKVEGSIISFFRSAP